MSGEENDPIMIFTHPDPKFPVQQILIFGNFKIRSMRNAKAQDEWSTIYRGDEPDDVWLDESIYFSLGFMRGH